MRNSPSTLGKLERHIVDGTLRIDGSRHQVWGANSNGVDVTLGELSNPGNVAILLAYLDKHPMPEDWVVMDEDDKRTLDVDSESLASWRIKMQRLLDQGLQV